MKKLTLLLGFCLIYSSSVLSAVIYKEGKITSVKMFGDVFVIYIDSIDTACTSTQKRVAIKNDDPIYSAVISTALTAKTTGATIQIGYHDQCTNNANAWDFESLWLK